MTTVTDVSTKLGEYMLKGWALTDSPCLNSGCPVPLMRSPNGRTPITYFCANCDESPTSRNATSVALHTSYKDRTQTSPSISSSSHHSGSSTPPTAFSSDLSSPIFAPPVETAEALRRRQQSDSASSEIGKRLLKGWAMLADECPNVTCFGVPLVRPPKAGGGKDPRKECVICSAVYISENDLNGRERLVPVNLAAPEQTRGHTMLTSSSGPGPSNTDSWNKEETVTRNEWADTHKAEAAFKSGELELPWVQSVQSVEATLQTASKNTSVSALEIAAKSLERTLILLSERLTRLSSEPPPLDPLSISQTAEAICKVVQALSQAKQLYRVETQIAP